MVLENFDIIEGYVSKHFHVEGFHSTKEGSFFVVNDYHADEFSQLVHEMDEIGYIPFMEPYNGFYRIGIAEKPERGKSNIGINILLFVATIATTLYAGYTFGGEKIWDAVAFSAAIIAILGTHETAHFAAARKHGVDATLPYFVPAPTLIGTFGAVINVKSPIPTKNALFDLGFSGPVAGIIVAVPVLIMGIMLSSVIPAKAGALTFDPPLLMSIFIYLLLPPIPAGYGLNLHPVAFAGWVGIIVTMLNLMPVAFLDGGHISRSLFDEGIHKVISILGIAVTLILGWIPMAILMFVVLFATKRHPGALDNVSGITKWRKFMAVFVLLVFILCLSPVPGGSL
ncbi:site-2 protease family protein [Methanobacterium aggregans]|uniref:site-2 protease family protein n=1 Tax=Methanobacterium aggregans TaxID=1615586 RepID=UPI00315AB465